MPIVVHPAGTSCDPVTTVRASAASSYLRSKLQQQCADILQCAPVFIQSEGDHLSIDLELVVKYRWPTGLESEAPILREHCSLSMGTEVSSGLVWEL